MSIAEKAADQRPSKPRGLPVQDNNVPSWLREIPNWVVWRYEWRDAKGGKSGGWTKVLFIPGTDRKAKSNNPKTWRTFEQALRAYRRGGFDGIGFVLKPGGRLLGLDLDKCLDSATGKPCPWAQPIIDTVIEGYGEVSPSGSGLKFIVAGDPMPTGKDGKGRPKTGGNFRPLPKEWTVAPGAGVEIYHERKFFAVTGHSFQGCGGGLENCDAALRALFMELDSRRKNAKQKPRAAGPTRPMGAPPDDDQALIDKALSARNSAKFRALWGGDFSGYQSQSEADQALCSMLAFWTGPDEGRIDRLFRQSGLMREKWERDDYCGETIKNAIGNCREFYDWNKVSSGDGRSQPNLKITADGPDSSNKTDVGNGQRLAAESAGRFRYCHPWKAWYVYRNGVWQPDECGEIDRLAKATIRRMYQQAAAMPDRTMRESMLKHALATENAARIAAMIKCAQSEPGIPIMPDDFDRDIDLFNFKNCTVDLRTGISRPQRREDYISKISPVEFIADAGVECPLWDSVLHRVLAGNASLIAYTQRLLGYCCTGSTKEQILPIWHGEGQNGKSTILNIVLDILGDYGGKAAPELLLKKRTAHPTELADLFGKRLIVANETDDGSQFAEALAKDLTGSDRIKARKVFKDFFQFTPTHKIVVATNHTPRVKGADFAFWRRIKLTPFTVIIPEEEKDPDLPEKLKAELPGIARWLVNGCLAWRREGLLVPEVVAEATAAYRKQEDTFGNFLEACCVIGQGHNAPAGKLLDTYVEFSGDKEMNKSRFAQILTKKGFTSDRYTSGPNKGRNGWWGLGLVAFEHAESED